MPFGINSRPIEYAGFFPRGLDSPGGAIVRYTPICPHELARINRTYGGGGQKLHVGWTFDKFGGIRKVHFSTLRDKDYDIDVVKSNGDYGLSVLQAIYQEVPEEFLMEVNPFLSSRDPREIIRSIVNNGYCLAKKIEGTFLGNEEVLYPYHLRENQQFLLDLGNNPEGFRTMKEIAKRRVESVRILSTKEKRLEIKITDQTNSSPSGPRRILSFSSPHRTCRRAA